MENMFATFRASSWEEIKKYQRPLWAYRGQSDSCWPLETGIYRIRHGRMPNEMTSQNLRDRESWILYQFSRYAHQLRPGLPDKKNILDWLALIQHYGGPTRLLDMTYSVHVAAFFAVEGASGDAAIWAINLSKLNEETQRQLKFESTGRIDTMRQANNQKFEELMFDNASPKAVIHVEPDEMHERLWTQQGLFLAPTDPNEPFMTNLANTFGVDSSTLDLTTEIKMSEIIKSPAVIKIIIPRDLHRHILNDLKTVNITAATLFPGLEGFARSLKLHV